MKRLASVVLLTIFAFCMGYSEAEVTKDKKDISILPVFASKAAIKQDYFDAIYFDGSISKVFSDLKRFNVIGYSYRFDTLESIEKFIQKIQEAKKQAALQDPKFIDADLGVVVISGEEMAKLAKSFFVVIPVISTFQVTPVTYKPLLSNKEKQGFKAEVTVSVRFIDAEGKLLDIYNANGDSTDDTETAAYKGAVDSAMAMFTKFVRSMDQFKLKTQVKALRPDGVVAELGKDMGVLPGYEYTVAKDSKDEFEKGKDIGLIRVRQVSESNSLASVIFGFPQVGDQLIEAPMANMRFTGLMDLYIAGLGTTAMTMVPAIGLAGEYEIGYDIVTEARITYLMKAYSSTYYDFYIPAMLEIGASWEIYLGPLSLQPGFDLGIAGLYGVQLLNSDNNQFYMTDVMAKVKVALNMQLAQGFKVRVSGGYCLAFGLGTLYGLGLNGPVASAELVFRF